MFVSLNGKGEGAQDVFYFGGPLDVPETGR